MDFENFCPARDFYYLAFLLLGAGTGCILNRWRRKSTHRSRNWAVVTGLCFFSGAFAALTLAIIYSNGRILLSTPLYPYLGFIAVIMILALRFPKAAGFPLIILAGVFVVWISCGYLRFPVVNDTGLLRLTRETGDLVHIIPVSNEAEKAHPVLSFRPGENSRTMEFRAFSFSFSGYLPVVGGVTRGDIAEIRCGEELLYADPRFSNKLFAGLYLRADSVLSSKQLFSFNELPAVLELKKLKPGEGLTVFFEESGLIFR